MKKIISVALAACMTLTAGVCAMAANTVEIEEITVNGAGMVVNFNTSGLEAADQVTLLTYQADSADAEATEGNIKYIDQIDKAENTSISFNLAAAASGNYQVKMGGTDVSAPSVMSITVDKDMSGVINFMPNDVSVYSAVVTPDKVTDEKGNIFILKPSGNHILTAATAPAKDGYTVKAYGVRLNGKDYQANVDLTGNSNYGVLFHGAGVKAEMGITAVPYVVYADAAGAEITYFGNSNISVMAAE